MERISKDQGPIVYVAYVPCHVNWIVEARRGTGNSIRQTVTPHIRAVRPLATEPTGASAVQHHAALRTGISFVRVYNTEVRRHGDTRNSCQ